MGTHKFRIVPKTSRTGLRYYLQYKGLFFWKEYYTIAHHCYGNVTQEHSWDTVDEAVKYVKNTFGSSAKIVDWKG